MQGRKCDDSRGLSVWDDLIDWFGGFILRSAYRHPTAADHYLCLGGLPSHGLLVSTAPFSGLL